MWCLIVTTCISFSVIALSDAPLPSTCEHSGGREGGREGGRRREGGGGGGEWGRREGGTEGGRGWLTSLCSLLNLKGMSACIRDYF